jgi:hypothetical protein
MSIGETFSTFQSFRSKKKEEISLSSILFSYWMNKIIGRKKKTEILSLLLSLFFVMLQHHANCF